MSKQSDFRGPSGKQHGNMAQTLLKSERQHLFHILWSMWKQLRRKKSLSVMCKILRLFVNILTADDNCFLLNRDNLTQPIQVLLPGKQKTCSEFFFAFLKFRLNFEHYIKRDEPHTWCISEITDSEERR